MKKDVAIVFGITKNYTFALANVLIGMKKHCKKCWDDIIVYHDGIPEEEQNSIKSILECKFVLYDVENKIVSTARQVESAKTYSLMALSRFECFALLNNYHKIIWHDVDILVQKDFSDLLLYSNISGFSATKSSSFRVEQNFYSILPGYDMLGLLINSGLLVISDKLQDYNKIYQYCYDMYNKHANILRYNDQAVINMMIQDFDIEVEIIDIDKFCCHPTALTYKEAAIIHAYGENKFWNSIVLEKQFPEWMENHKEWENMIVHSTSDKLFSEPKVSIIMSVYERTEYMKEAINSILQQTYNNIELIVVVEYSKFQEQIVKELKSYNDSRIIIITNSQKLGFAASLNIGLEMASGVYIARMDDDDISVVDRIEKQVRFLEKNHEISVLGGWIKFFGQYHHEEHKPLSHNELQVLSLTETPIFHPTVMIRKETLDKYGFHYSENWFTEDYELWTRMINSVKFANLPEVLLNYRASGTNATASRQDSVMNSHLDVMRKNFKDTLNLDFNRDEMRLLRQPSIINECFNSDEIRDLRNSVCQKIYEANDRLKVYDSDLLEKSLGTTKVSLKTQTKSRLRNHPRMYSIAKKIYNLNPLKSKINADRGSEKNLLLKKIKMKTLPPSSMSFHSWRLEMDERLSNQENLLYKLLDKTQMTEQRIIWTDDVLRRCYRENNASFWAIFNQFENEEFINLNYRIQQYERFNFAFCLLDWIASKIKVENIFVLSEDNIKWEKASINLGIDIFNDTDLINNENTSINIDLMVLNYEMIDKGKIDLRKLSTVSNLVLCYDIRDDYLTKTEKQRKLDNYETVFFANNYSYYNLGLKFADKWELPELYKKSIDLYILNEDYNDIVPKLDFVPNQILY